MAQTTSTDLIVPTVWGDMMAAEFLGRTVFGQEGAFAQVDDRLEGQPGERITLPKWTQLGGDDKLDELSETGVIVPDKLDTDESNTAVIKEAGKGAEVTDRALLVGYGDPLAEVRRQFGVQTVNKIDGDLRASAEAGAAYTLNHAVDSGSTEDDSIDRAGRFGAGAVAFALGKFGDDADPADMAGIVIHSKQRTDALRDPNFINASTYGPGQTIVRGQLGDIYGVPVIVSDRTSQYDLDGAGAGTAMGYNALLIKRGALVLFYKRRPVVETDRDILARSTVVTTNVHYATGVANAKGIVVVKTK